MFRPALRNGLLIGPLISLVFLLAAGGQVLAQSADAAADLRRRLGTTVEELDATLDALSYLTSMQASERVYFVLPWSIDDDALEPAWGFVTYPEAIHAITLHYLLRIAREGVPFDRRALSGEISRALREARILIAEYADDLQRRAEHLTRQRNELEALLAELEDPPAGRCVHLVNVARENQLGGTMGTDAELDGTTSVIRTYAAETGRGYPAQYTISWTSLPARICIGEPFTIAFDITNELPTAGRSPGASVGLVINGPAHFVSIACTNPVVNQPAFLGVDGGEAGGTNTCSVTFHDLYATAFAQRWLLRVRAGALGAGEGWLWYEYQDR
jgi:hypothetical protein